MLDLANRFWDWRAIKIENNKLKLKAKQRALLVSKKYGKWMKMCKEKPLYYVDPVMTLMFEECIQSGLKSAKRASSCRVGAEFNNGFKVNFWVANKHFAYASKDTTFTSPLGTEIKFPNNSMPDMYMCMFIEEKVEKFAR